MKLFGKNKETLQVKRWRAVRAMFVIGDGHEEVEIQLITKDNEKLTLRVPQREVPQLIGELTDAYEAINPPLSRRRNGQAGWDGADNN